MNSSNSEHEPLIPEPRPGASGSEENSWAREDTIIHALLKGHDDLYTKLGGEWKQSSRKRDKKSGKVISSEEAQRELSLQAVKAYEASGEDDQSTYGEEGYVPSVDIGERHPNFYRNILKDSFDERLFRVLEREYPQMRISIQESTFPKAGKATANFWEVRLGSEAHRVFLDNLLRRENLVLHLLEESCKPFMSKQYERLAETLGREQGVKLPSDFTKRLIARAYAARLKDPLTANDPFHSERIRKELKGLPDPISNEGMEGIIKQAIDVELKRYTQKK